MLLQSDDPYRAPTSLTAVQSGDAAFLDPLPAPPSALPMGYVSGLRRAAVLKWRSTGKTESWGRPLIGHANPNPRSPQDARRESSSRPRRASRTRLARTLKHCKGHGTQVTADIFTASKEVSPCLIQKLAGFSLEP